MSHFQVFSPPAADALTGKSPKPAVGICRRNVLASVALLPVAAEASIDLIDAAIAACCDARELATARRRRCRSCIGWSRNDLALLTSIEAFGARLSSDEDHCTDGPAFALWDS